MAIYMYKALYESVLTLSENFLFLWQNWNLFGGSYLGKIGLHVVLTITIKR